MSLSLRANLLKTTPDKLYKDLILAGAEVEKVTWYDQAFIIHNLETRELTELDIYKSGDFYIQNLSSMLPAIALDPQPGEKILDMCAAPGSKTSQIASMAQNKAFITALDVSRDRMFKLQAVLQKQGVENYQTGVIPGQVAWKKYPQYFDRVLLDAPCSMQQESGPDIKKAKLLAPKQRYLLRSALSCCKIDGVVIYSTCSTSKIENEAVVEWLLEKELGNVECDFAIRVSPDQLAEGFFLAKLHKIKSNI